MELKNLKDFYEKQTYLDYNETKNKKETELQKRIADLTFCVNAAAFSVILVIMTYLLLSATPALLAVPLAILISLVLFIASKKGISKLIKMIIK